jgi:hypothetical protein
MGTVLNLAPTTLSHNNADIASHLRELAEEIEAEDLPTVRTVIVLVEHGNGELEKKTIGAPIDHARATGLMAIAIAREL